MVSVRPQRSSEHRVLLALALALPVGLVALGLFLDPDPRGWGTHEQLGFQPCFPMSHWNVPCPGCGVTTAVSLAVHGRPLASLRTQPFGVVVLATAALVAVGALALHRRGRDLSEALPRLPWRRLVLVLGGLMLVAWLYKLAAVRGWLGGA